MTWQSTPIPAELDVAGGARRRFGPSGQLAGGRPAPPRRETPNPLATPGVRGSQPVLGALDPRDRPATSASPRSHARAGQRRSLRSPMTKNGGYAGRWAAMAITEPDTGSDSGAIRTGTAVQDGDHCAQRRKIFVTAGERRVGRRGATLDRSLGKQAIKSFVVERSNPACDWCVSSTNSAFGPRTRAAFVLEDCRVPAEDLLGDAVRSGPPQAAFAGAMQTFDNTRPLVAAMALGLTRACLDTTRELLAAEGVEIDWDRPAHTQSGPGSPADPDGGGLRRGQTAHPARGIPPTTAPPTPWRPRWPRRRRADVCRGRAGLRRAVEPPATASENFSRNGPGRQDPRHLRGDPADPVARRRAAAARSVEQSTEVAGCGAHGKSASAPRPTAPTAT